MGKVITIDNYRNFKPSELVHSFVSDLNIALKSGKKMDMLTFSAEAAATHDCLPCLGGMAALGLERKTIDVRPVTHFVMMLGDSIRVSQWFDALAALIRIYPDFQGKLFFVDTDLLPHKRFDGVIGKKEIKELQKHVLRFVEALEKAGC